MRKGMVGLVTVVFCGALLIGGCAKKEVVKGEEPAAPPVTAEKPVTPPPAKPAPPKEEPVKEQPIKEAPATAAPEAAPAAKEPETTAATAAELEKVFFDFDSFVLSPAARDTLSKNAQWLKKNGKIKVQIEGHCDERGSDEYNIALGEKRAKSALNYLLTLGIPSSQLSVISYGKEKPADPGHDEAAWAKNRRDEFVVLK